MILEYKEKIIASVVNKDDEITLKAVQDYISKRKTEFDENIRTIIIDEDKLRHILKLGLTEYNKINYLFKKEED